MTLSVNRRGRDWQLYLNDAAGAEGATAQETLRQMDRGVMGLWKVGALANGYCPTKDESRAKIKTISTVNLSGTETEGARIFLPL